MKAHLPKFIAATVCLGGAIGCDSGGPPKLSDQQLKTFKGGPIPADAWKKIAERRRQFEAKQGKASGGAAPPEAAMPGSPPASSPN